jgi:hypothetical protein
VHLLSGLGRMAARLRVSCHDASLTESRAKSQSSQTPGFRRTRAGIRAAPMARTRPQSKAPADLRREALERERRRALELLEESERPVVEATAWYLSTFAIVTLALVLIAAIAVVIVLLAT